MKKVRKRMMMKIKILIINLISIHHVTQRANRIDTPTLMI